MKLISMGREALVLFGLMIRKKGDDIMLHLTYVGEEGKHAVDFEPINDHVVQLTGDIPVKGNGFTLSRIDSDDAWDYTAYRTVYKLIDGGVQYSNDGSVYVAPPEPEPEPGPAPYEPTLEEVKEDKKQMIHLMYQEVTAQGIDVELSTGRQHFPLGSEDITFLMGKRFELESGAAEVSYQDSNNRCMFLSSEDMLAIITAALTFINVQTTYRNNLCEWVDQCKTIEEIEAVYYGADIPPEYQNEVYKRHMQQQGGKGDEEGV